MVKLSNVKILNDSNMNPFLILSFVVGMWAGIIYALRESGAVRFVTDTDVSPANGLESADVVKKVRKYVTVKSYRRLAS